MKYHIGIDLSLTSTGYCLGSSSEEVPIMYGVIKTKPNQFAHPTARVNHIFSEIKLILSRADIQYVQVFLEGYAYGISSKNNSSSFDIAEVGGLLKNYLYTKHIPLGIIPPTKLKKYVTGKGNSKKELMIQAVYKYWNFDTIDNNIADAYGLMKMSIHKSGHAMWKVSKHHLEALSDIKIIQGDKIW